MSQYKTAQIRLANVLRDLKLWKMRNSRTPFGRRYNRLMDWADNALIIPRRQLQSMEYMQTIVPLVYAGAYFLAFLGLERHRISGLQFEYAIGAPTFSAGVYLALKSPERIWSNLVMGSAWAAASSAVVISSLHPGVADANSIAQMAVIGLSMTGYINALVLIFCRTPTDEIGLV